MIEIIRYKPYKNGTLLGFCDIHITKWEIDLFGLSLHQKNGKRWISLPSKEYKDRETGETKFAPIFRFRERLHFYAFCDAVKKGIDDYCYNNGIEHEKEQQQQEHQSF